MKRALFLLLLLSCAAGPASGLAANRPALIAFWSDRAGLPGVWVMKSDGTGRRLLTGARSRAKRGDFSPNGSMLTFDGQPPQGDAADFDIQVIGVDGRGRKRLTHGPARDLEPRWSPTGRRSCFSGSAATSVHPSIWTVRPSGGIPRRLAAGSSPVWSADGSKLLFSRPAARGQDIYVMHADGTGARPFYRSRDDDYPSAWSNDGKRILFTRISRTTQQADVWAMKAAVLHDRSVEEARALAPACHRFFCDTIDVAGEEVSMRRSLAIGIVGGCVWLQLACGSGVLSGGGDAGSPVGTAGAGGRIPPLSLGGRGGGGGWASGGATPDPFGDCARPMPAVPVPPNLVIGLDTSSAMNDRPCAGCDAMSRWASAVDAINQTVRVTEQDVRWGLELIRRRHERVRHGRRCRRAPDAGGVPWIATALPRARMSAAALPVPAIDQPAAPCLWRASN